MALPVPMSKTEGDVAEEGAEVEEVAEDDIVEVEGRRRGFVRLGFLF